MLIAKVVKFSLRFKFEHDIFRAFTEGMSINEKGGYKAVPL